MKIKLKFNFAFTLIEILVVMAVIGILVAIVFAEYGLATGRARDASRKNDIDVFAKAIKTYNLDKNTYPAIQGYYLAEGYLKNSLLDPKTKLQYEYTRSNIGGKDEVAVCANLEAGSLSGSKWCWSSISDHAEELTVPYAAFASPSPTPSPIPSYPPSTEYAVVPVIFLASDTPNEDVPNREQVDASFTAIRDWYAAQLDGQTFNLLPSLFYRSTKTDAELHALYGNGMGIWREGLKEATAANDMNVCDDHRFYYFVTPMTNVFGGMVGAENLGCSHILPGTASIPGHMGKLIGGIIDPDWPEWWADEIREAQGAAAHEIGHGFGGECIDGVCNGLPHSSSPSIMYTWWNFNNPTKPAIFFDDEKIKVKNSPFIE